ncbi:WD40-repeat-containing domain protein [Rhodocollybia butyracea]|uniref:Probable cytosolic iron-sulfur protein assembly protein 1 n=1 Tax=Rhodocollybia butyracea TaxID=206335 RepID=A0A9P5PD17_9AGAR|nr:WD40-repeat-containing domain protein [Rhodocollybia butyracea]
MDEDFSHSLQKVAELGGHEEEVWHIAWNPAKSLLASCSSDKSVRLFTYNHDGEGTLKFSLATSIPTGHLKTVRSVAWSPSGSTLATASFDSNIGIWEQEQPDEDGHSGEWECASLLEGHETECKSVAYSSTGTLLASCSRDKTVWVWEVQPDSDFECMGVLMEHTQDVKCVAWHPTEEILASGSYDDTIKIYVDDPQDDWFCCTTLTGHESTVWALGWSPNGKYLASSSDDKTVRIWKRVGEYEFKCVLVLEGHDRSVYSVSWGVGNIGQEADPLNLGRIASAGGDGIIRVWDLHENPSSDKPTAKLVARLPSAHGTYDINTVVWCPRKGYQDLLATSGDDGMVKIWKIQAS